jgi:ABC-type transport system involved in cytochrome c biogenesis ATPase subunit
VIVKIDNRIDPGDSYAVERTRGLYNVGVEDGARFRLDVDVPVEKDDWQIGVVVGPSGSGKTSIARALSESAGWVSWSPRFRGQTAVIEALTKKAGDYAKATAALAAVGLGSVPSWLRPYRVLSNGEQFRASMADLLIASAKGGDYILDEFTSVLDRQVAQIGAGAFARQWRRSPGRRVILITPHYDILEWVEPDWWIDTAEGADEFASDRGVVQAREGAFQEARHHGGYSGDWVATLEC